MTPGDPLEAQAFQKLADAFEKQYPGVKVKMITVAASEEAYHARLSADLTGDTPADVVLLDYDAVSAFFSRDALHPLTDNVAQSTMIKAADFYPAAYNAFQWKGQQMCLPLNAGTLVVYYNKKLFDQAKQPYPAEGWTWEQFLADATALTESPERFGVAIEPELNNVLPFVWQNGGEVLSADATKLELDSPAAVEALQFVADWQKKLHVAPNSEFDVSEGNTERFEHGELAMLIDKRDKTLEFRNISAFDWDVAPLPQHKQAANILKSDGLCVPAKAAHPELAWKLVEYASSAAGQTILATTGQIVPANISVAQSPAFLDPNAKPAHSQVWLDELTHVHSVPPIARWPEIEEVANEEFEHAYFDTGDAARAAEEMVDHTKNYFKP